MKYERQNQKTPFDSWRDHHEYICGGEFPLLNPGQLIFSSDLINFFIFSSVEINCHLSVSWIQMYFSVQLFFFCFVLFFFFLSYLKLWHLFPFWHPVKTDGSYSSLSRGAEFLENQLSGEMMSCDMTVFPLPLHLCPTSTNMDDCNLDKSHNPGRYPSVPPEAAALSAPSSPDKGWLLAVQSNLWHEYTPGDCG